MMKKIIYCISVVLIMALYSCEGQYDNIDRYATDETVYVGKFSDDPYTITGYKRVEIELLGDSVGRIFSDDMYLGKAKKTIVEYDESEGTRKIEFDSVSSWVNITGLTVAKTYIFRIYAEDNEGNRSIPVEALGKPYTDEDLAGIAFPTPHVIPAPTTVEFVWNDAVSMGLSSPLYKFISLDYSYIDKNNKTVSGRLTSRDKAGFSITNLKENENTAVTVNCRIIPIMDAKQIIDTLSIVRDVLTKTVTKAEYLKARELRPIVSALVNPADETKATVTFGAITDHLKWTEIRYKKLSNPSEWNTMRIENGQNEALCEDFARNATIQIKCAYNPPTTGEEYERDWEDYEPFILKYDPSDWVIIPRHGSHEWSDGKGSQDIWSGGHPMLIFDSDAGSGWHSVLSTALPQVLIVDMKAPRKIDKIFIGDGSYWINVELYFTDDLSISGYETHHVNGDDPSSREQSYNDWVGQYVSKVPATVPESWGAPIVRSNSNVKGETFLLTSTVEKRFLIVRFPDSTDGGNYIGVNTLAVYSN